MLYLPNAVPTRESTEAVSRLSGDQGCQFAAGHRDLVGAVVLAGDHLTFAEEEDDRVVGDREVADVRWEQFQARCVEFAPEDGRKRLNRPGIWLEQRVERDGGLLVQVEGERLVRGARM